MKLAIESIDWLINKQESEIVSLSRQIRDFEVAIITGKEELSKVEAKMWELKDAKTLLIDSQSIDE